MSYWKRKIYQLYWVMWLFWSCHCVLVLNSHLWNDHITGDPIMINEKASWSYFGLILHCIIIFINDLLNIASANTLSPLRSKAITVPEPVIVNWTIRKRLQWNFNEKTNFALEKINLKMSAKWRPFSSGLNFKKGSWGKFCKNGCCSYFTNNDPIWLQFCICHHSWAVSCCDMYKFMTLLDHWLESQQREFVKILIIETLIDPLWNGPKIISRHDMGQATKLRLSCY